MKCTKWCLLFDNWDYKLHLIVLLGENGRGGVQGKGELIELNDVIFRLTL